MVTSMADDKGTATNTPDAKAPEIITRSTVVRFQGKDLLTRSTFHHTFATKLHFPSYYGENMDAWIDIMSSGEYILDRNDDQSQFNVAKDKDIEVDFPENRGSERETNKFGDEEDDLNFDDFGESDATVCVKETLVILIEDSDAFLRCKMEKELRECVEFINEKRAGWEMLKVIYE